MPGSPILMLGDCREQMKLLPDACVDSIITDPPYHLTQASRGGSPRNPGTGPFGRVHLGEKGFMGQVWDGGGVAFDPSVWVEALRVAKPGAMLLAFGGTRTFHRLACAIEDAGWEIRDCLSWIYGCLSSDTELLIDGQWEPYHKAIDKGHALCYIPDRDEYQWQPIQELVEYDYDDTAFHIRGDHTDQIVSRNHRCLVERGGVYEFALAETLECDACVPVLESVQDLLDALPVPYVGTGDTESVLRLGVQTEADAKEEAACKTQGTSRCLLDVRQRNMEAGRVAAEDQDAVLLVGVQRCGTRQGVGETRIQGSGGEDCGRLGVVPDQDEWSEEPGMAGWRDLLPQTRKLQADQVCPLPGGVSANGEVGRVCNGTPAVRCACSGPMPGTAGGGASCEPRPAGQPAGESGTIRQQSGAQVVRGEGHTRSDLARVEPFHYRGKVWCIRVPSGAFVARRNGKVFVTGNSGFPKSLDISAAVDRLDAKEDQHRRRLRFTEWVRSHNVTSARIDEATGTNMGGHYTSSASQPAIMTREHLEACRHLFHDVPEWVERECDIRSVESRNFAMREVLGKGTSKLAQGQFNAERVAGGYGYGAEYNLTAPATDDAKTWKGWGTALKPAWEPIILAMKPCDGTYAQNAVTHGVAGLNIDGCRIGADAGWSYPNGRGGKGCFGQKSLSQNLTEPKKAAAGRWPSNLLLDEGAGKILDEHTGTSTSRKGKPRGSKEAGDGWGMTKTGAEYDDAGGASRFFFSAKVSQKERQRGCEGLPKGNNHPTLKPISLMRYLCRLTKTPTGGIVLDPFMGSGSTGIAALAEGREFVGIEQSEEYYRIACCRLMLGQSETET